MRIVLFILILLVVALLVAVASGLLSINQTQPARAPEVRVGDEGVEASGGQVPAFDIETGTISVETNSRNLAVPTLNVSPPNRDLPDAAQNASGNSAAQPE